MLISRNSSGCLFRYVSQSNQLIAIQFAIAAKTNAYFYKNGAILTLIREWRLFWPECEMVQHILERALIWDPVLTNGNTVCIWIYSNTNSWTIWSVFYAFFCLFRKWWIFLFASEISGKCVSVSQENIKSIFSEVRGEKRFQSKYLSRSLARLPREATF